MKPIKSVDYRDVDITTSKLEAIVTYFDGGIDVFTSPQDLQMVQDQIALQIKYPETVTWTTPN